MKKYFSFQELIDDYNAFLTESKKKDSIKSFKEFLDSKGFSTEHVDLIYPSIKNGTPIPFDDDFTLEKTGKGSRFGKRIAAFFATFLGSFAITMPLTAIAASVATIAGASVLGIEIMGSFWKTLINPALVGVGVGAVISTGYALSKTESKNKNRQLFNFKNWGFRTQYGSDKTMLREFVNQLSLNNTGDVVGTKLDKLLEDITSFCEQSLTSDKSKKLFNNGRDRIHYLELVARKLVDTFYITANKVNTGNLTKEDMNTLTAINMMLQRIASTVARISEDSKAFALISGQHAGKHSHLIKNLDIFANLNNYHNAICEHIDPTKKQFTEEDLSSLRKSYHKFDKFNTTRKHESAKEILNGAKNMFIEEDNLLKKLTQKRKFKFKIDKPSNTIVFIIDGEKFELTSVTNITNITDITYGGDNITIIYNDNSTKTYPKSSLKTPTAGPVINNALLAQKQMLDYIEGNFDVKDRLASALMNSDSTLTRDQAITLVNGLVKELKKSQTKGVVLRSRKDIPVQKLLAFLSEDWIQHKNGSTFNP